MTISISLLALHFLGDFVLQSDQMGINKSKSWTWLFFHTLVYSFCFLPFYGLEFWAITLWSHTITDAVTSRITSRLWFIDFMERPDLQDGLTWMGMPYRLMPKADWPLYARVLPGKRHWFFVVIGADQLIHYWTLAWTAQHLAK